MNKKILIVSILVFTMLILMPSIPAIQKNTVEESTYNGLIEQFNLQSAKEIKRLEQIKHPLLYVLVRFLLDCRWIRCIILAGISCTIEYTGDIGFEIEVLHPILYARFNSLFLSTYCLLLFWLLMSEEFGWNWEFPY